MKRSSLHILIAGCILALYTVASSMDFDDEQRDFQHYCNMVDAGHWPDYNNSFEDCPQSENEDQVRVSKDFGADY